MANNSGGVVEPPDKLKKSWADILGSSLPPSWNKNIIEVFLEKDERGPFFVNGGDCAKLLGKIGLNLPSHVEAVQICPNGRGANFITLKDSVSVDRFICHDIIEVNRSIRAVNVKAAGKRDIVVHLKGLHPNTKDQGVVDYLSKFGKMLSTKVIHCTFSDGPLKGLKNGDRSFKMELKPGVNIPTYHVLFGQKVILRYAGQKQTCARCYKSALSCMGGGVAKKCEAAGGQKVEFSDYVQNMWGDIGYSPQEIEVASLYDDHGDGEEVISLSPSQQRGGSFTPPKSQVHDKQLGGVVIKNFPKNSDFGSVLEFLYDNGLLPELSENVVVKENGKIYVNNIENVLCNTLVKKIHNSKYCDIHLVCNGIIPVTPTKVILNTQGGYGGALSAIPQAVIAAVQEGGEGDVSDPPQSVSTTQGAGEGGIFAPLHSVSDGHGVSEGATYAPLQSSSSTFDLNDTLQPQLERRKSVRDLVTDFSSCLSNLSSSGEETLEGWTDTVTRRKKKKRKASTSPLLDKSVTHVKDN